MALLQSVGEPRSYCLAPCNHKFHPVRSFFACGAMEAVGLMRDCGLIDRIVSSDG